MSKDLYNINAEYYPSEPFLAISYRARVNNGRIVTYQETTNEYSDGIHGFFTERLLSYDVEHQKEIDGDYLFKPGSTKSIEELFFREAVKDRRFQAYTDGSQSEDEREALLRSHIESWIQEYTGT